MNHRFFLLLLVLASALASHAAERSLAARVISDNEKSLSSRYMGFVLEMAVAEGDEVRQGELLYRIDSREIDAQKTQAELSISQAELSLNLISQQLRVAQINLSRYTRLYTKEMVSKNELEQMELQEQTLTTQKSIAAKQVAQAKAQLESVLTQYRYLTITAPSDGIIIQKNIREGEMALPGTPALILSDLSQLRIEAEISEGDLQHLAIDDTVGLEIPAAKFEGVGRICALIPSAHPKSHQFRIKVCFESKEHRVLPGMFARIRLQLPAS